MKNIKNILKNYTGEKITQIMKKNDVEFISAQSGICLLSSTSGSVCGNIRWCPNLALGSLFKATNYPQSVAFSFILGWSLLFCPAVFFISTRLRGGSSNI